MLEKKDFAMSMFMNGESLYRAKAEHYEEQAEKLEMERAVLDEKCAHLERELYKQSLEMDTLKSLLARHEEG